jgi:hypothetical protein
MGVGDLVGIGVENWLTVWESRYTIGYELEISGETEL